MFAMGAVRSYHYEKIQTARRKLTIEPGKPSVERPAQGLFHPPMALSAPPASDKAISFFFGSPCESVHLLVAESALVARAFRLMTAHTTRHRCFYRAIHMLHLFNRPVAIGAHAAGRQMCTMAY